MMSGKSGVGIDVLFWGVCFTSPKQILQLSVGDDIPFLVG